MLSFYKLQKRRKKGLSNIEPPQIIINLKIFTICFLCFYNSYKSPLEKDRKKSNTKRQKTQKK